MLSVFSYLFHSDFSRNCYSEYSVTRSAQDRKTAHNTGVKSYQLLINFSLSFRIFCQHLCSPYLTLLFQVDDCNQHFKLWIIFLGQIRLKLSTNTKEALKKALDDGNKVLQDNAADLKIFRKQSKVKKEAEVDSSVKRKAARSVS